MFKDTEENCPNGGVCKHLQKDGHWEGGIESTYNDWQVKSAAKHVILGGENGSVFHGHDAGKGSTPCHDYVLILEKKIKQ